jgi:hypothetical protein
MTPLLLREMAEPYRPLTAAAAMVCTIDYTTTSCSPLPACSVFGARARKPSPLDIMSEYLIGKRDMATIYMSPDPYFEAFNKMVNLCKFDLSKHRTAGLCLAQSDDHLFLGGIVPSTSAAHIPHWRSCLKSAWLIKIGNSMVSTITDAQATFTKAHDSGLPSITLLFSHPEICQDTSHDGLPIVYSAPFSQHVHDQMNNHWDFSTVAQYLKKAQPYVIIKDGNFLNYVTKIMKLTWGKLLQQDDWSDWQDLEYLQFNQYDAQGMFGDPVASREDNAIFHLVCTYAIKAVDGRKKTRCVCDGSMHSGMVRVLAETYANCIDQTSARLFYAIAATKNLLVFGADVSNAFAEAPPPKQGFFIRPDRAFHKWWVTYKKLPPFPPGHVIPVLSTMQGHPESPCFWEKHADKILREIGLTPTVYESCLCSGVINNNRVLFM